MSDTVKEMGELQHSLVDLERSKIIALTRNVWFMQDGKITVDIEFILMGMHEVVERISFSSKDAEEVKRYVLDTIGRILRA